MNISKTNKSSKDIYKIVDTKHLFILWCLGIVFVGLPVIIMLNFLGSKNYDSLIVASAFLPISLLIALACFLSARARKDGIIVDPNNDLMEFGGGGISANDTSDWIKKEFLFQAFRRHKIKISEIRQIDCSYNSSTTVNQHTGAKETKITAYYLKLNGDFGAIKLGFDNGGKRDELFSILRQLVKAGTPVFSE